MPPPTIPANASHTAELNTDVTAVLTSIETGFGTQDTSLSPDSFVVLGSQTARTDVNGTFGHATRTISINPFDNFHPGERVQATATSTHLWQIIMFPTAYG